MLRAILSDAFSMCLLRRIFLLDSLVLCVCVHSIMMTRPDVISLQGEAVSGLDLHDGINNTNSSTYSTILYTDKAAEIISEHARRYTLDFFFFFFFGILMIVFVVCFLFDVPCKIVISLEY